MTITLEIPEEVVTATKMTTLELLLELALALYASRRLSSGKASKMAQMSLWQFRQHAAARNITANLDVDDLNEEVATLQTLGLL